MWIGELRMQRIEKLQYDETGKIFGQLCLALGTQGFCAQCKGNELVRRELAVVLHTLVGGAWPSWRGVKPQPDADVESSLFEASARLPLTASQ